MAQLTEAQYNAVVAKVVASAPAGLDEASFQSLLDREIASAEAQQATTATSPRTPVAGRGTAFSTANQKANLNSMAEHGPIIGGSIGAFGGPRGAALGGALGALVRDANRANQGDARAPQSPAGALENVWLNAAGQGALSKGSELVGDGLVAGGRWLASKADPWIQAAIKPALTELREGARRTGSSAAAEARRIAGIVRRTGIRTPEAAEDGIKAAEGRIQQALDSVGPNADTVTAITDAPRRAVRYLGRLERNAARQMSPGDDVATIASERADFQNSSPLFQTVTENRSRMVPSTILDDTGKPILREEMFQVEHRVPRSNVTAGESLELARGTSRHATRKSWGEQKGMSVESQKAFERAGRDSAKAAAPPSMRDDLRAQGDLIRLKPVLDRMMVRQANRDVASFPGIVGAAPAVANGKLPTLGAMAQWMRNHQMTAGLAADRFGSAMQAKGADTASLLEMLLRAGMTRSSGAKE